MTQAFYENFKMALVRLVRRKIKPALIFVFFVVLWYFMMFVFVKEIKLSDTTDLDFFERMIQNSRQNRNVNLNTLKPPDVRLKNARFQTTIPQKETLKDNENVIHLEERKRFDLPEVPDGLVKEEEKPLDIPLPLVPNGLVKEGLGEYGKAVNISREFLTEEEKKEYDEGWKNNAFNEFLSNRISVNRSLPDPRDDECKIIQYPDNLPETSVIITVHNEAWTVLLRSIHSILNRTPEKLLKEIILVDDCSTMAHLHEPLEKYIVDFPKVKILRLPQREGLIRARLAGYRISMGKVLVFLDSHIECAEGWLEPMLDRIHQNWSNVMTPVIDSINDITLQFQFGPAKATQVGGFDWNLIFTWHGIPEAERKRRNYQDHLPVRSPTMAGGLFAISRDYFTYIGTYDDGMDIWGGENLEISFRIWMCGGTLETAPCSHIGHIFRKNAPYSKGTNTNYFLKNNLRLAEVWLDDYKMYYYDRLHQNLVDYGDISPRLELRHKLECKSFDWFLRHVYPEMWIPGESLHFGQIKSKAVPLCLFGIDDFAEKPLSIYNCTQGAQVWYFSDIKEIRQNRVCLDYSGRPDIQVHPCHQMGGNQQWEYREDNTIYHIGHQKCLEISHDGTKLFMNQCLGTDYQIWIWNREKPNGPIRNWNLDE